MHDGTIVTENWPTQDSRPAQNGNESSTRRRWYSYVAYRSGLRWRMHTYGSEKQRNGTE
jgi:hypothetical protein